MLNQNTEQTLDLSKIEKNEYIIPSLQQNLLKLPDSSLLTLQKILNNEIELEVYENNDENIIKGKWSKDEDDILRAIVMINGEKNWKKISQYIKGRTPIQCLHRWSKILRPGLIKGPWTQEEDMILQSWVIREGPHKWAQAAKLIAGRTGKQCRERWINILNPRVKKGDWSPEEDKLLFDLYKTYGSSWTKLAKHFAGRTENSIKNRFYSTIRKINADLKRKKANLNKNQELGVAVEKQTSLYRMLLSCDEIINKACKRKGGAKSNAIKIEASKKKKKSKNNGKSKITEEKKEKGKAPGQIKITQVIKQEEKDNNDNNSQNKQQLKSNQNILIKQENEENQQEQKPLQQNQNDIRKIQTPIPLRKQPGDQSQNNQKTGDSNSKKDDVDQLEEKLKKANLKQMKKNLGEFLQNYIINNEDDEILRQKKVQQLEQKMNRKNANKKNNIHILCSKCQNHINEEETFKLCGTGPNQNPEQVHQVNNFISSFNQKNTIKQPMVNANLFNMGISQNIDLTSIITLLYSQHLNNGQSEQSIQNMFGTTDINDQMLSLIAQQNQSQNTNKMLQLIKHLNLLEHMFQNTRKELFTLESQMEHDASNKIVLSAQALFALANPLIQQNQNQFLQTQPNLLQQENQFQQSHKILNRQIPQQQKPIAIQQPFQTFSDAQQQIAQQQIAQQQIAQQQIADQQISQKHMPQNQISLHRLAPQQSIKHPLQQQEEIDQVIGLKRKQNQEFQHQLESLEKFIHTESMQEQMKPEKEMVHTE